MSGFKYVGVLNIRKISLIWQCSKYASGCNYGRVMNIPEFSVCQVSAYASVTQDSEYAWIWLNNALWQGSEYAWATFHRVFNKLRIWQVSEYARVTQGADYAWKSLNMPWYALICLNNADMIEYVGIYLKKQTTEYARKLIVSNYKLLTRYRDRDLFRTLSNI